VCAALQSGRSGDEYAIARALRAAERFCARGDKKTTFNERGEADAAVSGNSREGFEYVVVQHTDGAASDERDTVELSGRQHGICPHHASSTTTGGCSVMPSVLVVLSLRRLITSLCVIGKIFH